MRRKILLIDDQPEVIKLLTSHLQAGGFQVILANDAQSAAAKAELENPAIILLNLDFPHIRGFEVCRKLQGDGSLKHIPIIILSVHAKEQDRILGFELGADDYVASPFSVLEVILRIKKSLQRHSDHLSDAPAKRKMIIRDLTLDPLRHEVTLQGNVIHLTPIEFKLLALLMENQGRAIEREALFNGIWGQYNINDSRTIDAHVKRLREKLGYMATSIETIIGFGYRLDESRVATLDKPAQRDDVKRSNRNQKPVVLEMGAEIAHYKNRKLSPSLNSTFHQVANAA